MTNLLLWASPNSACFTFTGTQFMFLSGPSLRQFQPIWWFGSGWFRCMADHWGTNTYTNRPSTVCPLVKGICSYRWWLLIPASFLVMRQAHRNISAKVSQPFSLLTENYFCICRHPSAASTFPKKNELQKARFSRGCSESPPPPRFGPGDANQPTYESYSLAVQNDEQPLSALGAWA